jgi:hypothetical protein
MRASRLCGLMAVAEIRGDGLDEQLNRTKK